MQSGICAADDKPGNTAEQRQTAADDVKCVYFQTDAQTEYKHRGQRDDKPGYIRPQRNGEQQKHGITQAVQYDNGCGTVGRIGIAGNIFKAQDQKMQRGTDEQKPPSRQTVVHIPERKPDRKGNGEREK